MTQIRTPRAAWAAAVLVVLAQGVLPAQGNRAAPTSLSAAWLVENMRHAPSIRRQVELYERALADDAETTESRAVAAARLLGVDLARISHVSGRA